MKFSKELSKKEQEIYIKTCSRIWGCVPVDVEWAIETKPYKEQVEKNCEAKILNIKK